jgi:hypothetical protein
MQPGPNIFGGIGIALALIAGDEHSTGDHTGDTGQSDPLP